MTTSENGTGAPEAATPEGGAPPTSGGVVVVAAAKGGCGATTVAVNLAAKLAETGRTCLVDFDFCKGDVAGFLDIKVNLSISSLLERAASLDEAVLAGVVSEHASGLHVLPQPYDLTDLREPHLEDIRAVLQLVRGAYTNVVVDVGSRVDVASLTAASLADHVLLVSTPDVPGLRDAQRMLSLYRRLDLPPQRVHLVINGGCRGEVPLEEIERQLTVSVVARLARDEAHCGEAGATGRLLMELAPRAELTQDIARLAALVRGEQVDTNPPRRFAWLRGR